MSRYLEQGVVFPSGDNKLVGIVAVPDEPASTAVLIVVGGPQYRVGSHRQFTLLARQLAEAGIASLRFDYTGMGDSEGKKRSFEESEGDIFAALGALNDAVSGLSGVVLWGLCDAASTAMMFAHRFPEVTGMVLLNPWVHSGEYSPRFKLSQYYRPLLSEKDHWQRLLHGKVNIGPAFRDLARASVAMIGRKGDEAGMASSGQVFVQTMLHGVRRFKHPLLIVLSENDLTSKEFSALARDDKRWKAAIHEKEVQMHTIAESDHTFSKREWQEEVTRVTIEWVLNR